MEEVEAEEEEEEEEASDTGRVGCSWCIKRPPGYTYIYVCVRVRARGTAAPRVSGRSADISDTVRARFSPFRSLLSLSLSHTRSRAEQEKEKREKQKFGRKEMRVR